MNQLVGYNVHVVKKSPVIVIENNLWCSANTVVLAWWRLIHYSKSIHLHLLIYFSRVCMHLLCMSVKYLWTKPLSLADVRWAWRPPNEILLNESDLNGSGIDLKRTGQLEWGTRYFFLYMYLAAILQEHHAKYRNPRLPEHQHKILKFSCGIIILLPSSNGIWLSCNQLMNSKCLTL